MSFLVWIVFGAVVGVVAKLLMPGRDPGGFFHVRADLDEHAFHDIHAGGFTLENDDDDQCPDGAE